MVLKVYKKADIQIRSQPEPIMSAEKSAKTSLPKAVSKKKVERGIRIASAVLVALGAGMLGLTLWPYVTYYSDRLFTKEGQTVLSASNGGAALSVESRFSPQYFNNVEKNIAKLSAELVDANTDYSALEGEFYLTVPAINIDRALVKLNVDSFNEDEYLEVLKTKFAHFKGSSIPGKVGTTFVYGHSTAEWYAQTHPGYFPALFTYLSDLSIGDEIFVEHNGIKYTYTVTRVYEVNPSDLSPVFENNGRKLLKLMTCSPPGVGTDRLIIVAEQINEETI